MSTIENSMTSQSRTNTLYQILEKFKIDYLEPNSSQNWTYKERTTSFK